jgi:hypothetical protein
MYVLIPHTLPLARTEKCNHPPTLKGTHVGQQRASEEQIGHNARPPSETPPGQKYTIHPPPSLDVQIVNKGAGSAIAHASQKTPSRMRLELQGPQESILLQDELQANKNKRRIQQPSFMQIVETKFAGASPMTRFGCFQKQTMKSMPVISILVHIVQIVKKKMAVVSPMILFGDSILYEAGDDLDEDELRSYAANAAKVRVAVGVPWKVVHIFWAEQFC